MAIALVLCEESQAVTKALRAEGVTAYSCDLKPCTGGHPEWHIQGDAFMAVQMVKADLIIAHPPCTHISVTGNRHYGPGKPQHHLRVEAAGFIQRLWDACTSACEKVAFENPIGQINTLCDMPRPSYIEPYWFGNAARKKTGLWLHGLPPLKREVFDVEPEIVEYTRGDGRKTTFSRDYMVGVDRGGKLNASTARSKTYSGVAKAMAGQWGPLIK